MIVIKRLYNADVGWSDAMRYHNGVSGSFRQQWPLISGHYVSFVSFVLRQQHFLLVPSSYLAKTRLRALSLVYFPSEIAIGLCCAGRSGNIGFEDHKSLER